MKLFIKYLMRFIKVILRKIIIVIIIKKIPKNIKTFQEHKYLVLKVSPCIYVLLYYNIFVCYIEQCNYNFVLLLCVARIITLL